jgi:hypothetical protein
MKKKPVRNSALKNVRKYVIKNISIPQIICDNFYIKRTSSKIILTPKEK